MVRTLWFALLAHAPVELPDGQAIAKVDFERHAHALIDRLGCNAGKCHGNRDGKGGLALSLFAASPAADHAALTRGGRGRYVNVADPEQSLLLLKATGAAGHEGGMRLTPGSWEYHAVRQWIADGAGHEPGRGQLAGMEVVPSEHVLLPGEAVQLKVIAQFADGTKEDVTCFCDFRLPETESVSVSATGKVSAAKPGDVAVRVFYRGRTRVMRALVAFPAPKDFVYPTIPETNFIDREVFRLLRRLNIVPAEPCDDARFLRRVSIGILGTLPTPEEVRAFTASKDPDKRTKKIDELLAHPRHAAVLATRLCEMTDLVADVGDGAKAPRAKAAQMAHDWFRKRIHENMPYDRIVTAVLTATSREGRDAAAWAEEKATLSKSETGFGSDYAKRATLDHFWRNGGAIRIDDPAFASWGKTSRRPTEEADAIYLEEAAARTAAAFLGIQLECARCHNHPVDGWTPTDHRAFAALFGRVQLERITATKAKERERDLFAREVFLGDAPFRFTDPTTGAAVEPRLLGGPVVGSDEEGRAALARWLTRADNPFFARHFVNVMWSQYFEASLVESIDVTTSAFPAAQQTLLDLLAKGFIESKFDIRRLERTILLSRTYQLATTENASNKHDRTCFSHAVARRAGSRLSADMLHAAFETREDAEPGVPAGLAVVETMHKANLLPIYENAYRDTIDRLLARFGRKELVSRCDPDENLSSYLHVLSNPWIAALQEKSKRAQRLAKSSRPLDEMIDECFLAALARVPTRDERKAALEFMRREPEKLELRVQDLLWALINTKEFLRLR